ncbi:MAG: hypothetical protein HYY14_01975 [Candidatus Omnitrophica bacterium]|nr:hypothetical protein [Candidatus Omnitrophota bacterium]
MGERDRGTSLVRGVRYFRTSQGPCLAARVMLVFFVFTVVCLVVTPLERAESAGVPDTLTYQGKLLDSSGNPVTATKSITFAFYTASSGGSALYSESKNISVTSGIFNRVIGDGSGTVTAGTVLSALDWDQTYYLEITVDGTTLSPRQQLTPVGYAFNADTVDAIEGASLLRSDTSDSFTSGTLTISSGAILSVSGSFTSASAIAVGGIGQRAYSAISSAATSAGQSEVASADDLFIRGDLEVDGTIFGTFSGTLIAVDADTLDDLDSTQFLRADVTDTYGSPGTTLTVAAGAQVDVNGTIDLTDATQIGIRATTLDGFGTGDFLRATTSDTFETGTLTLDSDTIFDVDGTAHFDLMVGIGDATPDSQLEVVGSFLVSSNVMAGGVSGVAYNAFSDSGTASQSVIGSDDDVYIEGSLEVSGTVFGDNVTSGSDPGHTHTSGSVSGDIDGSGTTNRLGKFSDSDTLTSSGITDTSDAVAITIDAGESVSFAQNVIASGDLVVNGSQIGITSDLDLIDLLADRLEINGSLIVEGDLAVQGSQIGLASDADLISLTANLVDINGSFLSDAPVGIGTSTPATNLDLFESNTDVRGALRIRQDATGDASLYLDVVGSVWAIGIDNSDTDSLKFSVDNTNADVGATTQLTLTRAGNLTLAGDLFVEGSNVGLASDTNLLALASTVLTVDGTLAATTVTGANVTSGEDPGHTHTTASVSGEIDGSGTTNRLGKFSDSDTLTSSGITDTSDAAAITIDAGESVTFAQNVITSGDLFVDGSQIGMTSDTDLMDLLADRLEINGSLIVEGDLAVQGSQIGLATKADLMTLSSVLLDVDGSIEGDQFRTEDLSVVVKNLSTNDGAFYLSTGGSKTFQMGPSSGIVIMGANPDINFYETAPPIGTLASGSFVEIDSIFSGSAAGIVVRNTAGEDPGIYFTNDTVTAVTFASLDAGQSAVISTLPGGNLANWWYEDSTSGENQEMRIYGYPTGASAENYGSLQVTGSFNDFTLLAGNASGDVKIDDTLNVTGDVEVDGSQVGLTSDTDLLTLAANILTVAGDVEVNGSQIGLTSDTDLMSLAADVLTVNGTVAATTVTGANVTTGADPGHTHTGTSLSTIDISGDTNLTAGDKITLTDDDLDVDGTWTSFGLTLGGDLQVEGSQIGLASDADLLSLAANLLDVLGTQRVTSVLGVTGELAVGTTLVNNADYSVTIADAPSTNDETDRRLVFTNFDLSGTTTGGLTSNYGQYIDVDDTRTHSSGGPTGPQDLYGLRVDVDHTGSTPGDDTNNQYALYGAVSTTGPEDPGNNPSRNNYGAYVIATGNVNENTSNYGLWAQANSGTQNYAVYARVANVTGTSYGVYIDSDDTWGLYVVDGPNYMLETLEMDGDLAVDGSEIGLTSDTNLMSLAANLLTVNGTMAATTVTGANVTSGADPGHTHTGTSLSTIDISDDTNLTAGDKITLTDDDLDVDGTWTTFGLTLGGDLQVEGSQIGLASDADIIDLLDNRLEVNGSLIVEGDLAVQGSQIGLASDADLLSLAANQLDINGTLTDSVHILDTGPSNAVAQIMRLQVDDEGTTGGAAGMGARQSFYLEDFDGIGAGNATEAVQIEAVWDSATDTTEIASLRFSAILNGGMSEAMRLGNNTTLNALFAEDIEVNGSQIGMSSDTDLMSLAADVLTVNGTMAATTVTGANVTTGADPGHTHTGTSLSTIDISGDTNLTAGDKITLTDDDLDVDGTWTSFGLTLGGDLQVEGSQIGMASDADIIDLLANRLEVNGSLIVEGDLAVQGSQIGLATDADLLSLAANLLDVLGTQRVTSVLGVTGELAVGTTLVNNADYSLTIADAPSTNDETDRRLIFANFDIAGSTTGLTTSNYGQYIDVDDTRDHVSGVTGPQNLYGLRVDVDHTGRTPGDDTNNQYAIYGVASTTGGSDVGAPTRNNYGAYVAATGNENDSTLNYGIWAQANSGDTNYAVYARVANVTGTSYGVYIDSDDTWGLYVVDGPNYMLETLEMDGDLIVDGSEIGLTSDTNLLSMAANLLTVNGSLSATTLVGTGYMTLSGDLYVNGSQIGMSSDTDLIGLTANLVTVEGDLMVDGSEIGISSDTNLLSMAANDLTVNGSVAITSALTVGSATQFPYSTFYDAGGATYTGEVNGPDDLFIDGTLEVNESSYFESVGVTGELAVGTTAVNNDDYSIQVIDAPTTAEETDRRLIFLDFDLGGTHNVTSLTNYGQYIDLDDNRTTQTNGHTHNTYGLRVDADYSGVAVDTDTFNLYGVYGAAASAGSGPTTPTYNNYGVYGIATGNVYSTTTNYGVYAQADSADTNYAVYASVSNVTGTSYGVYIDSDDTWGLYVVDGPNYMLETLEMDGDLAVDGSEIGISSDTNLLSLAANDLTINGSVQITSTLAVGGFGQTAYNNFSGVGGATYTTPISADDDLFIDGDLEVDESVFFDGNLFVGTDGTGSFNVGGTYGFAYNIIADNTIPDQAVINSDDDLYIEGNLEVDGTIFAPSGNVTAGDVAENYWSKEKLEPGDVVVMGDEPEFVKRSNRAREGPIAGVVSTQPGWILSGDREGSYPIALLGTVPVKAVGPIQSGDFLVASPLPGVAQSAGSEPVSASQVIGTAWEGLEEGKQGTVRVLLR